MTGRLLIPSRGEVLNADFDLVKADGEGHLILDENGQKQFTRFREHGDVRPCVDLSINDFNRGSSQLVIVLPITSRNKNQRTHVPIQPPEGGLKRPSFAITEGVRSIARQFLLAKYGVLEDRTMREIEVRIRELMLF